MIRSPRIRFRLPDPVRYLLLLLILPAVTVFFGWAANGEMHPQDVILVSVVLIVLQLLIAVLVLVAAHWVIRTIARDESHTSVMPLFEEGSVLSYRSIRHLFREPQIKGFISGLPVTVQPVNVVTDNSQAMLRFIFTPLYHPDRNGNSEEYIEFEINRISSRLCYDVKPEVLQFVAQLKEKGYFFDDYCDV